jgi:DNA-binding beta-propeller fold protein YncE
VIRKLVAATGVVTTIAGQPNTLGSTDGIGMAARFNVPIGLALDGQGNLYIAERDGDRVRRLSLSTGAVTTVIPASAGLQQPHELAYDPRGVLYVADTGNHVVRRIEIADGAMTIVAGQSGRSEVAPGALPASLNSPSGLAVGSDGLLYVATGRENAILRLR